VLSSPEKGMNDKKVIQVDRVSKKFSRSLRHMMLNAPLDIGRSILGLNRRSEELRKGEFWAIDEVSLSLDQGMRIGLIGRNGSGKSTLLKMLNGTLLPDRGSIQIRGRVGALIELGAGFHPVLTGRENIFINGSIMGMKTLDIRKKFEDIIAFADIGDFLDSPVKFYSSGMYVRLGFSVAVHSEPDILLMDEVLAVGDIAFQKKCFDRLDSIVQKGTTIIFVSHSMAAIQRFCPISMLLEKGKTVFLGDSREAAAKYYQSMMAVDEKKLSNYTHTIKHHGGSMGVYVNNYGVLDVERKPLHRIRSGDAVCLSLRLCTKDGQRERLPRIAIRFIDSQTEDLMVNIQTPSKVRKDTDVKGCLDLECKIDSFNLSPGIYRIEIKIGGDGEDLHDIAEICQPLEVNWSNEIVDNMSYKGHVYLPGDWKVKKNGEIETLL
jgi:lipopolysaccharide transport system ATP-binding protein